MNNSCGTGSVIGNQRKERRRHFHGGVEAFSGHWQWHRTWMEGKGYCIEVQSWSPLALLQGTGLFFMEELQHPRNIPRLMGLPVWDLPLNTGKSLVIAVLLLVWHRESREKQPSYVHPALHGEDQTTSVLIPAVLPDCPSSPGVCSIVPSLPFRRSV